MKDFLVKNYKGKKILVTGATGFKGSWLSLFLNQLGAEVLGLGLEPDTEPSLFEISGLRSKINLEIVDIREKSKIEAIIKYFEPDMIFHLAAQPLVRESYENPLYTFETNVLGTVNLFECCRNLDYKGCIINITSDKVYKNADKGDIYDESSPIGGDDPYSASKSAADIIANSYRKSFGLKIASARAGNVIGGGDWGKGRLLPDIVRALVNGEEIIIRNPNSTRPWQYILDCITGYLLLGANLSENYELYSDDWNFSPCKSPNITVENLVSSAISTWGQGNYKILEDNSFKEKKFLALNSEKASKHLGWKTLYDTKIALEKTIFWYKKFYSNNYNMFEESVSDIQDYIRILPVLKMEITAK